jgi:hypothetical protein
MGKGYIVNKIPEHGGKVWKNPYQLEPNFYQ